MRSTCRWWISWPSASSRERTACQLTDQPLQQSGSSPADIFTVQVYTWLVTWVKWSDFRAVQVSWNTDFPTRHSYPSGPCTFTSFHPKPLCRYQWLRQICTHWPISEVLFNIFLIPRLLLTGRGVWFCFLVIEVHCIASSCISKDCCIRSLSCVERASPFWRTIYVSLFINTGYVLYAFFQHFTFPLYNFWVFNWFDLCSYNLPSHLR